MSSVRGLNARPQTAIVLPVQLAAEVLVDLVDHHLLLRFVDFVDRFEHPRLDAMLAGHLLQRPHVFREATAAVADAGEQEREADAAVVADAAADVVDVAAHPFAEVGHLVDEADLRRRAARWRRTWSSPRFRATSRGTDSRCAGTACRVREIARETSYRRTPTTTRSGLMKSSIAEPSFRNSGLLATSHSRPVASRRRAKILALVPTGTVLLVTTMASVAQVRRDAVDDAPQGGEVGGAVVALRRADGEVDDLGRLDRRRPGRW